MSAVAVAFSGHMCWVKSLVKCNSLGKALNLDFPFQLCRNLFFDKEMHFFPKSVEQFFGNDRIFKKGKKTAILVAVFFNFGSKTLPTKKQYCMY